MAKIPEIHVIPNDEEEEILREQARSHVRPPARQVTPPQAQPQQDVPTSEPQREQPMLIEFADELEREPEQEPHDLPLQQAALR